MKFNRSILLTTLLVLFATLFYAPSALAQTPAPTEDPAGAVLDTGTPAPTLTPIYTPSVNPSPSDTPPTPPINFDEALTALVSLSGQFATLAGIAALIAALVNILKLTPLVNPGNVGQWYAGLSFVAFLLLAYFGVIVGVDLQYLDSNASKIAAVLVFVGLYLSQVGIGQVAHAILKRLQLPAVSTSFSASVPAPRIE